jgi:hypothetical protein
VYLFKLPESPPISLTEVQEKIEVPHDFSILQQLLENLNSSDFADRISDLRASRSLRGKKQVSTKQEAEVLLPISSSSLGPLVRGASRS